MSNKPLISVVLPVYNGQRYLAAAVSSVLMQSMKDFELIVIDDGSTDGSLAILEGLARRDQRVRLVSRENRGLVATLNEGISLARAPFIARMDADDICLPQRLARQWAFLQANAAVVCVGGYYQLMDQRGRHLTTMTPPSDHAGLERELLAGHTPLCHPSAMMRAQAVRAVGGYDPAMMLAEDLDLWLRLGEIGRLAVLPEPVIRYRLHGESVSEKAGLKQRQVARAAVEAAWRRRGISGRFEAQDPSRPQSSRRSRHRFALLYGWWAFGSGQRRTAMLYGLRCVSLLPWNLEGWRLAICAAVKPMPGTARGAAEITS
ncbi:MAG: glycosyltransferase [Phycisphaeraceae bacterium]